MHVRLSAGISEAVISGPGYTGILVWTGAGLVECSTLKPVHRLPCLSRKCATCILCGLGLGWWNAPARSSHAPSALSQQAACHPMRTCRSPHISRCLASKLHVSEPDPAPRLVC